MIPAIVREATPADAPVLALVGAATFLSAYAGMMDAAIMVPHCAREHSEDTYRALLSQPGSAAWLVCACTGGAPLGYALACRYPGESPLGSQIELRRLYLLPQAQGAGHGRALVKQAARHARAQGARRLLVGVWEENVRAIAFYEREGFTRIGTRPFRVGEACFEDPLFARDV